MISDFPNLVRPLLPTRSDVLPSDLILLNSGNSPFPLPVVVMPLPVGVMPVPVGVIVLSTSIHTTS